MEKNQTMTDEQLARERQVDAGEQDAALRDDRHAVERDALVSDGGALLLLPVGLAPLALGEGTCERLGPSRVDRRVATGEEAARFDELDAHYDLWRPL